MTTQRRPITPERPRAPVIDVEHARACAAELFAIDGSVRPLPSYIDQNFLVSAEDGRRWVLRIANGAESAAVLDLQNEVMTHLRKVEPGATPEVRRSRSVETVVAEGVPHMVRMVSYLDGPLLADAGRSWHGHAACGWSSSI